MSKLKLPFRMRAAVNTYFAIKHFYGGSFPSSVEKDEATGCVVREAAKCGMTCTIVPGIIYLRKGAAEARVNSPVLL
jgi:hypothetical protein